MEVVLNGLAHPLGEVFSHAGRVPVNVEQICDRHAVRKN